MISSPWARRPAWTAPADDWCRETATRMHADGYTAGAIIQHLEAYGCGLFAAQAIVIRLQRGEAA